MAPSAKAPYGTDNNMFIRGVNNRNTVDPVLSAAINQVLPIPQRSYASVPGALNAFEESYADEDESVYSETHSEIPPHLKSSIQTVSSEPSDADYADFTYHRSCGPSRRMSTNSSHIKDGLVPENPESSFSHRKHFGTMSADTKDLLEWPVKPAGEKPQNVENIGVSNNILAHQPDLAPLPYRPSSRMVHSESVCPFATDSDDLSQLRVELLKKPLGKIPPPTHAA